MISLLYMLVSVLVDFFTGYDIFPECLRGFTLIVLLEIEIAIEFLLIIDRGKK